MDQRSSGSTRRQVLRDATGFTLALPFLPSLLTPGEARAQTAARAKHFVMLATGHGAALGANLYPADSALTDRLQIMGAHEIRAGKLTLATEGQDTVLSPILRAPSNRFTPLLVGKMNIVRGLDVAMDLGHHTGGFLGNYARNNGTAPGASGQENFIPTIDQLMAWSPGFYPNINQIKQRAMNIGQAGGGSSISWNHSNPAARTGDIIGLAGVNNPQELFTKIFVPGSNEPPPVAVRKSIVDRVLANYHRLRNGNRRLSIGDRQRLDDHLAGLDELQRKLNVMSPSTNLASCKDATRPADASGFQDRDGFVAHDPTSAGAYYQLMNDVIATAFACGTSNIATVAVQSIFSTYSGNWHQDVAHRAEEPAVQPILAESNREFFSRVYVDLIAKLDAIDTGAGTTLLDDSLVIWTHESGVGAHQSSSMPVIAAGSAGGFFKTGIYLDMRNRNVRLWKDARQEFAGLTYNRWLATILDSMGVRRSEWETPSSQGYGLTVIAEGWTRAGVGAAVMTDASKPMPLIVA